ncbi:MAG: RnfABCDGE type electron transport complex subunit G [Candidatus Omnitrophota bacterium]
MKESFKIISVLTSVCVICAFLLAFVYGSAKEKIAFNAEKAINDAITTLAPEAKDIEELILENNTVYKLFNNGNICIGYAFLAQGQGYQGKIQILSVTNPEFKKLLGIEIIDSVETPGLGAKIKESQFKEQFKGLNIDKNLECLKTEPEKNNQIQAITGATVSSMAVVNILNKKIEKLKILISAD